MRTIRPLPRKNCIVCTVLICYTVPEQGFGGNFLAHCVCRGDHWSPANLPQQRIFPGGLLTRQTGTGEQCSPLQEFLDSLRGCLTSPKKKDRSCRAFFGFTTSVFCFKLIVGSPEGCAGRHPAAGLRAGACRCALA